TILPAIFLDWAIRFALTNCFDRLYPLLLLRSDDCFRPVYGFHGDFDPIAAAHRVKDQAVLNLEIRDDVRRQAHGDPIVLLIDDRSHAFRASCRRIRAESAGTRLSMCRTIMPRPAA